MLCIYPSDYAVQYTRYHLALNTGELRFNKISAGTLGLCFAASPHRAGLIDYKHYDKGAVHRILAMREGKEVRTWDTSMIDKIREVLTLKDETTGENKYQAQDVTDWIVTYAARRAYESGISPPSRG